ncbi:hypothetical protein N7468_000411 [Penicillium chermesinum]|uniref:Rhodopsin domain-containing protein n=1 Tax=Penicillium chermesinum TaxID=63820 RepID=A0A9W9TZ95_9EURO|nr:uncharacterized protein N7468_000411 [Penicillium chermesinum]KAJ5248960.1 hypothetical protein N7468_000411 [Penicillium chermesinum]KAJ6151066.1 hypothetical protein N7470_007660 [Penicillium chermesinum]
MESNVDLSESRTTTVNVCYSIPIPIMLLFTGLRLFIKLRPSSKISMSFDDYMIIFATAVSITLAISGLVYAFGTPGPPYGYGRHEAALSPHEIESFLRGDYIFSHLYDWAIASIKLAILALYYRIFSTVVFRRVVIATAVFIVLWLAAMEIGLGLQCIPVEKVWNTALPGSCLNLVAFSYFTNITNLVTDIWIFLLPLPVIFSLHVTRKRKFEVAGVFTIGILACGVSIARLTVVVSQGSSDFTWAGVPLGILSVFETLGGIICANIPFLYRVITRTLKRIFSSLASSGAEAPSSAGRFRPRVFSSREQRRESSIQSEWAMLSRNTDKDQSLSQTNSNMIPDMDINDVELQSLRRPRSSAQGGQIHVR